MFAEGLHIGLYMLHGILDAVSMPLIGSRDRSFRLSGVFGLKHCVVGRGAGDFIQGLPKPEPA